MFFDIIPGFMEESVFTLSNMWQNKLHFAVETI